MCVSCKNNEEPQNAVDRQKACDATRDRNPFAFKDVKHDKDIIKGCHCLKSHCLKRYCECYQNGIICTDYCRCSDCQNKDGSLDLELQRSTNTGFPVENDIAVIASASAHANNRKRTYLLIDDKDNETDRKIQVNTLTNVQALDYFNALLGHDGIKELLTYDIQEKMKEKLDKNSLHIKVLEEERKKKKVSQKLLNTFSDFFEINKDVQRAPIKAKEDEVTDGAKKTEKKTTSAPVAKVTKEVKSGKESKSAKNTLEDDHVIMEDEANSLNWKKRMMNQTTENDNTSDSELDTATKSPKKSKRSESSSQKAAGYMFEKLQ